MASFLRSALGMRFFLPFIGVPCVAVLVGCSSGDTASPPPEGGADGTQQDGTADVAATDVTSTDVVNEGGGDVTLDAPPDASGDVGLDVSADAPDGAGATCPNVFDDNRPDAGGVCCCRSDIVTAPVCAADGGSPACSAGFDLHHDSECDPRTLNGPCTAPSGDGGHD